MPFHSFKVPHHVVSTWLNSDGRANTSKRPSRVLYLKEPSYTGRPHVCKATTPASEWWKKSDCSRYSHHEHYVIPLKNACDMNHHLVESVSKRKACPFSYRWSSWLRILASLEAEPWGGQSNHSAEAVDNEYAHHRAWLITTRNYPKR